jgi:hypothetical protein
MPKTGNAGFPIPFEAIMKRYPRCVSIRVIVGGCLLVTVLGALFGPTNTYGLWLPWAKEEDKVKKAVEDVWKALIWNDKKLLKEIVAGPAAQAFVDQQMAVIKNNGIKNYQCQFKNVTVDKVQGKIAFAEYYKIATLNNGSTVSESVLSAVEKIDGQWKMTQGHKSKKEDNEKENDMSPVGASDEDHLPTGDSWPNAPAPQSQGGSYE